MRTRNSGRFRKNSLTAAAAATTAMGAGSASAAIVLINPPDIVVTNPADSINTHSTLISLPGAVLSKGGDNDFSLGLSFTNTSGKSGPVTGFYTLEAQAEIPDAAPSSHATALSAAKLDFGTTIDFGVTTETASSNPTGFENVGDHGFIGFNFTSNVDDTSNTGTGLGLNEIFGWVRLERTAEDSITIYEWAYEDTGATILAGEGGTFTPEIAVPEPGALMLLAAGAVFAARMHARRKHQ